MSNHAPFGGRRNFLGGLCAVGTCQVLSFDAYNKFIEDDFLGGQRLNPATDGRPDSRPDVRESESVLGNLAADFDFSPSPRPPVLLSTSPPPEPASTIP